MSASSHYERRPSPVLPPPVLAAFAAIPFGVVLPPGAWEHWKAVALWQLRGHASVEIISGPAGVVTITKAGRRSLGHEEEPTP